MAIFNTQDLIDIVLDTGQDLVSATVTNIKYIKPDGTTGTWTGAAYDSTKVKYEVQPGDLDDIGLWTLQAIVTIGGRTGYGDLVKMQVDEKL
jgi:hypothetical protein